MRSELRVAVVVNPRSSASERLRGQGLARLRESSSVVAELATSGDASDGERLARLVSSCGPDVLVAAGGDGTASLALRSLLETGYADDGVGLLRRHGNNSPLVRLHACETCGRRRARGRRDTLRATRGRRG